MWTTPPRTTPPRSRRSNLKRYTLRCSTRVETLSRSYRAVRWSRERFDAIAERSQFADHLARSHLLRLFADGRPAFLVPNSLVKNLPDQAREPVGDGGVGRLIEQAPHLPVALGAAMTVVRARTLLAPRARAIHDARCFDEGNVA